MVKTRASVSVSSASKKRAPIKANTSKAKVAAKSVHSKADAGQKSIAAAAKLQSKRVGAVVTKSKPAAATVTKQAPKAIAAAAVASVRKAPVAAFSAPVRPAAPVARPAVDPKKPVSQRHGFRTNEHIVYPAHGVGRIVSIEEQEVAGTKLELFVITFDKDKMTLKVPTFKTEQVGMRKLSEEPVVKRSLEVLKGRARVKRTMWSRRAQEYEAKINSGDLIAIAEVVRDLYRSESQPEQSYSERQLYEAALDRMARELAAVEKLDERGAVQKITEVLSRSARGRAVDRGEEDNSGDGQVAAA